MAVGALQAAARWVRQCNELVDPARRLVCMPHAGGTVQAYRTWPARLPADLAVHAVQYPGRQDRLREPCAESIADLVAPIADALTPLMTSPLTLFGHSMGAIVAYEVTVELERRHGPVVDLLVVSGSRAPHYREPGDKHLLTDQDLIDEISRINASFGELRHEPELLDLILPAIRSDYRLISGYARESPVPVQAPLIGLGGVEDPDVSRAELSAWSDFSRTAFDLAMFPGGHFYLADEGPVLQALSSALPAGSPRRSPPSAMTAQHPPKWPLTQPTPASKL